MYFSNLQSYIIKMIFTHCSFENHLFSKKFVHSVYYTLLSHNIDYNFNDKLFKLLHFKTLLRLF